MWFTERLYVTRPEERLGFVQELITQARNGDMDIRSMLTNRFFLGASFQDRPWLFYRRSWNYPNIAKAAHAYCRKFWGASVESVVENRVPEPETGEVLPTENMQDAEVLFENPQNVVSINIGSSRSKAPRLLSSQQKDIRPSYERITLAELKRRLRSVDQRRAILNQFRALAAA
jgi:hypothetical protein